MFISFEGVEGSGKSTQIERVSAVLRSEGYDIITTVEPGSTHISEGIRKILLDRENSNMDSITELFLFCAARAQLVKETIMPALKAQKNVLTDRFFDSTTAYQGYGRGIDINIIEKLNEIAVNSLNPDITLLFDMDVEQGFQRKRSISKLDRLEMQDLMFHKRVRQGYKDISKAQHHRFKVIDASLDADTITTDIVAIIKNSKLLK